VHSVRSLSILHTVAKKSKVELNTAIAKNNQATRMALLAEKKEAEAEIQGAMDKINAVLNNDRSPAINPLLAMLGARNKEAEALQAQYANVIDNVASSKDAVLNAAEELLYGHKKLRIKSYKKTVRHAQAHLSENQENQKLAADPNELVKHLKRAIGV